MPSFLGCKSNSASHCLASAEFWNLRKASTSPLLWHLSFWYHADNTGNVVASWRCSVAPLSQSCSGQFAEVVAFQQGTPSSNFLSSGSLLK